MTNQEAKMAWAEGKKLEWRSIENGCGGLWRPLNCHNSLALFDYPDVQFRIAQEPIALECVVGNEIGNKALYCDKRFVAYCRDFGIDPPLGAKVKLTVEVE